MGDQLVPVARRGGHAIRVGAIATSNNKVVSYIYIYIFSYFYFKTRSPSESMVTYGNILSPPQWKVPAIFL